MERYRGRLSGPLRDRIDLTVEVAALTYHEMSIAASGEPTAVVRARVLAARARQRDRLDATGVALNARLPPRHVPRLCRPDTHGARLLERAVTKLGLSARAHDRVLRVARTIADLSSADAIDAAHVAEAVQFRMVE